MTEKIEDLKKDIEEMVTKIVGKINNIDSKKDRAETTQNTLNNIVAMAELSKIEKAGTLAYLLNGRLR